MTRELVARGENIMENRQSFMWLAAVALVVTLAAVWAPRTETISGGAKVIDGDSLYVSATEIRLHAIDAFEGRQVCQRSASTWDCGSAAADKLRALTRGREIACEKTDTDSYGRTVAICSNGELDLGAEMVRSGLALAYRKFGDRYVEEEDEARRARRGAWSGDFTPPWDERHGSADERPSQRRDGAEGEVENPAGPSTCRGTGIKGNINREGERIYHVPGSQSYDVTIIDESKGERWFCTEEQARRAGWRAPRGGS
jgi:endonuclease YncB( thermonuclease family)